MKFDTKTAAGYAADKLDSLLERAQRDTTEVVQTNDIPTTVAHYAALQDTVDDLFESASRGIAEARRCSELRDPSNHVF